MQNGYAYCNLTRALPQVLAANCSVYASVCVLGATVNVTLGVMTLSSLNFNPNRFEFSCTQGLLSSAINQVYLVDGLSQKIFLNSSLIRCVHANSWCGAHGEAAHRYQCYCSNANCGFTRATTNFIKLVSPVCGSLPQGFFNQEIALPPTPSQCVFPSIPTGSPTTSSPTFSPTRAPTLLGPGDFPLLPLCRPLSTTITLPSAPADRKSTRLNSSHT